MYKFDWLQIKCLLQVTRNSDGVSQKVVAGWPSYEPRYHVVIVIPYVCVSCLCMVFLLGFGSCLLHVQVRERKRWSPELGSLRGGVYMDGWPARCGDRVDRGLSSFQFV